MTNKDAVLRLLQQRKAEVENKVDWERVRDEWLSDVEALFSDIRGWLEQPQSQGLVKVIADAVTLHEEQLGSYDVPVLRLEFPGAIVDVRPIARLIIGAGGRVDFERSPRKVTLVRPTKNQWAVVEQVAGSRNRTLLPFDQDAFWGLIGQLVEET